MKKSHSKLFKNKPEKVTWYICEWFKQLKNDFWYIVTGD